MCFSQLSSSASKTPGIQVWPVVHTTRVLAIEIRFAGPLVRVVLKVAANNAAERLIRAHEVA